MIFNLYKHFQRSQGYKASTREFHVPNHEISGESASKEKLSSKEIAGQLIEKNQKMLEFFQADSKETDPESFDAIVENVNELRAQMTESRIKLLKPELQKQVRETMAQIDGKARGDVEVAVQKKADEYPELAQEMMNDLKEESNREAGGKQAQVNDLGDRQIELQGASKSASDPELQVKLNQEAKDMETRQQALEDEIAAGVKKLESAQRESELLSAKGKLTRGRFFRERVRRVEIMSERVEGLKNEIENLEEERKNILKKTVELSSAEGKMKGINLDNGEVESVDTAKKDITKSLKELQKQIVNIDIKIREKKEKVKILEGKKGKAQKKVSDKLGKRIEKQGLPVSAGDVDLKTRDSGKPRGVLDRILGGGHSVELDGIDRFFDSSDLDISNTATTAERQDQPILSKAEKRSRKELAGMDSKDWGDKEKFILRKGTNEFLLKYADKIGETDGSQEEINAILDGIEMKSFYKKKLVEKINKMVEDMDNKQEGTGMKYLAEIAKNRAGRLEGRVGGTQEDADNDVSEESSDENPITDETAKANIKKMRDALGMKDGDNGEFFENDEDDIDENLEKVNNPLVSKMRAGLDLKDGEGMAELEQMGEDAKAKRAEEEKQAQVILERETAEKATRGGEGADLTDEDDFTESILSPGGFGETPVNSTVFDKAYQNKNDAGDRLGQVKGDKDLLQKMRKNVDNQKKEDKDIEPEKKYEDIEFEEGLDFYRVGQVLDAWNEYVGDSSVLVEEDKSVHLSISEEDISNLYKTKADDIYGKEVEKDDLRNVILSVLADKLGKDKAIDLDDGIKRKVSKYIEERVF